MRRLIGGAVVLAGMLGVTGCQRSAERERADLARREQKARAQITDIRQDEQHDLAKRRAEAQEDVAEVQKDVAEERQDVAQAEREQGRADTSARGTGGSGAAGHLTATGKMKSSLGDNLVMFDEKGAELKLDTDRDTKVTYNGQPVELDDYKKGTQLRVSYSVIGEKKHADDVVIINPVKE